MLTKLAILGGSALPLFALAQGLGKIETIVRDIGDIVQILVGVAFLIAILAFFWGLAKYILAAGDETKAQEGKSIMIYGTIAIFVMVSIFGIVAFLQNIFGIENVTPSVRVPSITVPNI